jgi:predicted nuclease with TOPRIM domain
MEQIDIGSLQHQLTELRGKFMELHIANANKDKELTAKDAEIARLKNDLKHVVPLSILEQAFDQALKKHEERVRKHNGTSSAQGETT